MTAEQLAHAPVFVIRRSHCAAYFSVAPALPVEYERRELVGLGRGETVCGCQACLGVYASGLAPLGGARNFRG